MGSHKRQKWSVADWTRANHQSSTLIIVDLETEFHQSQALLLIQLFLRLLRISSCSQFGINSSNGAGSSSQVYSPFPSSGLPTKESMQHFAATQYYLKLIHPHPSNLSVSNFVTVSLTQKNHLIWENQVLNMIGTTGFAGFIDGSLPIPPKFVSLVLSDEAEQIVNNVEYLAW